MKTRRLAQLALLPLIGGAGLVGPAASPAAAQMTTAGSELYVSNKYCSPAGVRDGSAEAPFCTIQAAADAAGPGQTVLVQPGEYLENVSFTRSGTESAPITFRAVNLPGVKVSVGKYNTTDVTGVILVVSGAHDVVIEGFTVFGANQSDAVEVVDSSRITLDKLAVRGGTAAPTGVEVSGDSHDVTISRSYFYNYSGPSIDIDPGTSDVTVTGSQLAESGLLATDSPGLTVTGNTVVTNCRRGIEVAGTSPSASIRNNIVETARLRRLCTTPQNAVGIGVSADSVRETSVDHNLFDPVSGGVPYHWAGHDHPTLASFVQATGQGSHDILADPLLEPKGLGGRVWYQTMDTSAARDSADANARGALNTDMLDNPYADDPATPNTGTGSGYRDRGAVEAQGVGVTDPAYVRRKAGGGPLDVVAGMRLRSPWPVEREPAQYAYKFADERYWHVTDATSMEHTYRRAGSACVQMTNSQTDFRTPSTYFTNICTVVGARYMPLAPTRLLDTRIPIGTQQASPMPANSTIDLPVESIGGIPAADISALVLNVTVTQPSAAGFITVYSGNGVTDASSVNFVAKETVPNQVTVPVNNGRVSFRHTGSGSVHVVADLQGFYAASGSGFAPLAPVRMLDSRAGTTGPFPANTTRALDLSAKLPANATAAILNVTVTKPTGNGVLKVFPAGNAVPVASNLNFVTGQTIPNLVTVPVTNGKVSIHNQSAGSTHVVVDLAGYFSPDATQTFVPLVKPTRIVDTRTFGGVLGRPAGPLASRETVRFEAGGLLGHDCGPACPAATALVGNLTVTGPTAPGVLIAYPGGQQRPTASNVNYVAGETASNAAVLAVGNGIDLYNSSPGTAHAIVDESGYFIGPAS